MTEAIVDVSARAERTEALLREHQLEVHRRTDRMFAGLLIGQWIFAILIAFMYSPYAWSGKVRVVHAHVYMAVLLGGVITSLPVMLAVLRPGEARTRHLIAIAQMLWSALLIHLTGGRIETHFHVFGSLAFLAFYRDWRVLVPATVVVVGDHLIRQLFWPESVFGTLTPESWRFLEHGFWVAFEDVFLVIACLVSSKEMSTMAVKRAEVELLSERHEQKSRELDRALEELKSSQDALVRSEKLAAVGQLAASVGHELRNPMAAVRNANAYVSKRLKDHVVTGADPRVSEFLQLIDRELNVCARIISDLLDFARERPIALAPCPLRPLIDEAVSVLPESKVQIVNDVSDALPVPDLDREQFRQIVSNLVQNAVEAIPPDRDGRVVLKAEMGGDSALRLIIEDNGAGMSSEVRQKIFEPLFTTKTRGTGLGLAIVANMVKRHKGKIHVESQIGQGSRFLIDIPAGSAREAAG